MVTPRRSASRKGDSPGEDARSGDDLRSSLDFQVLPWAEVSEESRRSWDKIVDPESFYCSSGWLNVQSSVSKHRLFLVTVFADATLIGGTPIYVQSEQGLDSVCKVGSVSGNRNTISTAKDFSTRRPEIIRGIVNALLAWCSVRTIGGVVFEFQTADVISSVEDELGSGVFERHEYSQGVLVPKGRTCEEYLSSLGRKGKAPLKELRRFREVGLTVELVDSGEYINTCVQLMHNTALKYNQKMTKEYLRQITQAQIDLLPDNMRVFACFDESRKVIGVALAFEWKGNLFARVAGFDYGATEQYPAVYFNVACYALVDAVAGEYDSVVHLGLGSLEAKLRRGASLERLTSLSVPL